jgi:transposase
MEVLYTRCCGVDVHKSTITACVRMQDGGSKPRKIVRRFGAMTGELRAMANWLVEEGVTHVAMESTGVYWKPVWNILEGQFTLVLANAQHQKCARSQDGHERQRVAGRIAPASDKPALGRNQSRFRLGQARQRSHRGSVSRSFGLPQTFVLLL